jgi:nitrogen fixation protein FixH
MALATFIGFFAVIFAVNGVMLTMALKTHSGLVANEPYRKGLRYNERIAADAEQAARGWTSDIDISSDMRRLVVRIADRDGKPVDDLIANVLFGRPTTTQYDVALVLAPVAPGRYEAALPPLDSGSYLASLEVLSTAGGAESDIVHRARRRLWLKQ